MSNLKLNAEALELMRRRGEATGGKALQDMTPEEAQRLHIETMPKDNAPADKPVANEWEVMIAGAEKTHDIPVTVYKPDTTGENPPVIVFFHGGGWMVCNRKTHEPTCRIISQHCGAIVCNVDYRLAPEHRLPAGIDDCRDVTRWVLDNKKSLGATNESKVGVAGDSSGGHVAGIVAYDVPGLEFQVLIHPVTDMTQSLPSYTVYAEGFGVTAAGMAWYRSHALPEGSEAEDERWHLLGRPLKPGLPPALIQLAQADPLTDDGIEYYRKLCAAGVDSELIVYPATIHGIATSPGIMKTTMRRFVEDLQRFLGKHGGTTNSLP